nr:hypothetical protein CFP56_11286 [Quercus suber]
MSQAGIVSLPRGDGIKDHSDNTSDRSHSSLPRQDPSDKKDRARTHARHDFPLNRRQLDGLNIRIFLEPRRSPRMHRSQRQASLLADRRMLQSEGTVTGIVGLVALLPDNGFDRNARGLREQHARHRTWRRPALQPLHIPARQDQVRTVTFPGRGRRQVPEAKLIGWKGGLDQRIERRGADGGGAIEVVGRRTVLHDFEIPGASGGRERGFPRRREEQVALELDRAVDTGVPGSRDATAAQQMADDARVVESPGGARVFLVVELQLAGREMEEDEFEQFRRVEDLVHG